MSFKPMIIEYILTNNGQNAITYDYGTDNITVSPNNQQIIYILLNNAGAFTLTEANNPELPLTVTLIQLTDESARVSPHGTGWTVTPQDEQFRCMIQQGTSVLDRLTLDSTTQREGDAIVIVGTVEIMDHPLARKKPAPVNHQ